MQCVRRFPIIDIKDCMDNGDCFNGGTCWKDTCDCPTGYFGRNCEKASKNKFPWALQLRTLLLGRKFSFIVWVLCFHMQIISCVWTKFNLKVGLEIKVFLAQTIKFWSRYVRFANICIHQKRLTEVCLMIKLLNLIVSSR